MIELSEAKLEELLSMYEQGIPVSDISKELEMSVGAVRKALTAHGRKKTRLDTHSNEVEICRSYTDGLEVSQILATYQLTYQMLYTVLARNSVPIRKIANAQGRSRQLEVAIEMYQGGSPLWQIKQDTGVAQPVLHAELHRLGIPLRRPRKNSIVSSQNQPDQPEPTGSYHDEERGTEV